MMTLLLTLTLSTLHQPPPSSIHFVEVQPSGPSTSARILELDRQIEAFDTRWPAASVVLTSVGFGGAGLFGLGGLVVGAAIGALPGVLIMVIGLLAAAPLLLIGIGCAIWGATAAGARLEQLRDLEAERGRLIGGRFEVQPAALVRVATFSL